MTTPRQDLSVALDEALDGLDYVLKSYQPALADWEFGVVTRVDRGIARVTGLPGVQLDELVAFSNDLLGVVFNLDADEVGVVLLGENAGLRAGERVYRTQRVLDAPVGIGLLGRIVNAVGQPLDNRGPIRATRRMPVEQPAPAIMQRAPVTIPLQTGIKVVDTLLPIGRGQRELILGDRQTGKSALALDAILGQAETGVLCIYCAVGQRNSAVAKLVEALRIRDALRYSIVLVAGGDDAPGLQFVAPYAATAMGEYFMAAGRDVLIVYDDLTHHARAYRELSLLLRRPPGREAYPGDIFYVHSRLLERSTRLRPEFGGGSLTALPIVETHAQDMSAYIPTNLISITDGQIVLSPTLFQKGVIPAVDVGRSVSRVGGKAQLPAYRSVAGDLRLSYAQYEELEVFARFGTRLDDDVRSTLRRGRRVREVLKQDQFGPIPAAEQIAVLLALTQGLFDDVPLSAIAQTEQEFRRAATRQLPELCRRIEAGNRLTEEDGERLLDLLKQTMKGSARFARDGADHADD